MVFKRTDSQEPISYQALLYENNSLKKELNSLRTRLTEDEELRHAEEELRKSEERYRTLFMNMTDGFLLAEIICNKEGKPYDYRYLEVNPAFELHTGMKREQILGRTVLEVFPHVDRKRVEKYLEIAFTDKAKHFEVFSQKMCKYLDVYVFSPEKGKIAIIFIDITERKQIEEKTHQRAEEIETVMEVAPIAILISHDPQCDNITGNKMANEFYGVKTGENVSANIVPVRRYFHKSHELATDELPMQKAAFKGIDVRNEEIDVLLPGGEWRALLGSASPLHDAEGNVRGGVAAFMDITQRKKAEAKLKETLDNLEELVKQRTEELEKAYDSLKESEEHLRLTLEGSKAGMWMWDLRANWKITPQMNALLGRSESSPIKYEEFISMIHPEDQERVAQAWNKAIECKDFYDQEYRIFLPDGSIHWLSSKGSVIELHSGIRQLMGITTDITERKQAEEKIRYLANIVESSNDAIITKSLDGIITSWNKGAEQIYGYTAEEILGKNMTTLVPFPSDHEMEALIERIKKGEKVEHYETLRLRKDGIIINVSLSLSPVFDVTGKLTAISAIVKDITRSKKAEEALRKSKEQYQTLFNSISEGFANCKAIYNEHGTLCDLLILDINPAGARLSGCEREAQIGKTMREIWPDVEDYWFEAYQKVDQTGESIQFENFGNMPGKWFTIQIDRIEKGQFAVTFRDITEKKVAQEALAKIETARNKEIHHRIKNNLQVISSLLDLAAEKFRNKNHLDSYEVLEAFRESQNRVMSIAYIHKELHEGEGLEKLNFSLYLEKLAENLFQTYSVGHSGISLDLDLEDNVFFDTDIAVPLGMIVNELISNSLKYAFQGRDKGTIRIKLFSEGVINESNSKDELKRKNTKYTLTVSDNGIGIPDNINLENTDTLGLQLVSTLVDQLDGKIKIGRDQGTEFNICFNTCNNGD
ncbi:MULTISPECIES: PAS domain-containing sensor histidine kinase [Methanosarcina]|jgi:PAS domain S-box-containing protein|uniref:Sensory transduction histidine kinase n=1 Tax=Methanosarcina mazei S-6 TaxID=213585 RepID=A0A0E3RL24_METMZ|nr:MULTISPECIES: PAS domain S-box protein [Methanosarcina]AKB65462.1 sensory transduction histidine kinase [Methanosarcina mazei S-6]MDY0245738.1 PAS domain S-box protein [Methanosarcina mazei]WIM45848.1 PAS domain S-box protein [Methanosarcina mazei]